MAGSDLTRPHYEIIFFVFFLRSRLARELGRGRGDLMIGTESACLLAYDCL